MGLGKVKKSNTAYLVVAGGFIWNKKANSDDPNYATQEWTNAKGETNERKGAQYGDVTGIVKNVYFKTHEQYGEALYVELKDGDYSFTLNIKTNTANSQHMMKALLLADLNKPLFVKPYDFIGDDKRRAQGISFKQDGQKIDLKEFDIVKEFGNDWKTEKSFWSPSNKKKYTRWLEDLSDRFVAEIEEIVIPKLGNVKETTEDNVKDIEVVEEKVVEESNEVVEKKTGVEKITPLKMKMYLKEYILENYEDKELPTLTKEELKVWYGLALEMEELPFNQESLEEDLDDSEVDQDDVQAQLDALAGGM